MQFYYYYHHYLSEEVSEKERQLDYGAIAMVCVVRWLGS